MVIINLLIGRYYLLLCRIPDLTDDEVRDLHLVKKEEKKGKEARVTFKKAKQSRSEN